jgi:hypothetical protein
MLSTAVRSILNNAPILVGDETLLKPALSLMTSYRLVIEEIKDSEAITCSGSAITDLGELPSASVGRRDGGESRHPTESPICSGLHKSRISQGQHRRFASAIADFNLAVRLDAPAMSSWLL